MRAEPKFSLRQQRKFISVSIPLVISLSSDMRCRYAAVLVVFVSSDLSGSSNPPAPNAPITGEVG